MVHAGKYTKNPMGIRHGIAFQVIWIATELQILGSIVGADLGVNSPLVAADSQPMLQQVFDVGNLSFTVSWLGAEFFMSIQEIYNEDPGIVKMGKHFRNKTNHTKRCCVWVFARMI